mmetsp:Transcript_28653/g.52230  ORF Transcript_28653/g.52230 Transcript_28653/m.52230 type:complete len:185 (+) Transcript_28653:57-611(+)
MAADLQEVKKKVALRIGRACCGQWVACSDNTEFPAIHVFEDESIFFCRACQQDLQEHVHMLEGQRVVNEFRIKGLGVSDPIVRYSEFADVLHLRWEHQEFYTIDNPISEPEVEMFTVSKIECYVRRSSAENSATVKRRLEEVHENFHAKRRSTCSVHENGHGVRSPGSPSSPASPASPASLPRA